MSAKNQQTYRKRLALLGRCEIKVVVDDTAAAVLRLLAREHDRSHGEVLALALMLVNQKLTAPTSPRVSVVEPEPLSTEPTAPSPSPKEAWWPENYAALLSEA